MTMNRHEEWDELVSASVTGDLTNDERVRLDAHLAGCADCRATLAAFSDQRQIVAGLRHLPAPADLGARVRTGIEGGSRVGLPWWRRPATLFAGIGGGLAVVAGALLAIVLLNGSPEPQVGDASPTPSGSLALTSATPMPSAPAPTASPVESTAAPTVEASPAATPIPVSPEPDVYLALTGPFDNQMLTLRDGATGETIMELGTSAVPIAAELSPDGQWLAYITQLGESGLNEIRATRITDGAGTNGPVDSPTAVGDTVLLGESVAGSPFLEHLFWSVDGQFLAYTLADPRGAGTDAWIFRPQSEGEGMPLTDTGDAYAGSWTADGVQESLVWISRAGETPRSFLVAPDAPDVPGDPAGSPYPPVENVFQPLLSPNGSLAIYWKGRMAQSGAEWLFAEGAAPYLAEHREADGFEFADEREMFTDLTIGRSAFASAAITWGEDGDAYAVWGVQWTGTSQGPEGTLYPSEEDVYFSHATDARGVTRTHAIDAADMPDGSRAVDVKVSPTGRHLVITAAQPRAGVLDPARADLLIVERNTGDVADEVVVLQSRDGGWFGPGAFQTPAD